MSQIQMRKPMLKTFSHAFRGIGLALRSERNFKIHLGAAVLVLSAMRWLNINTTQCTVLLLCIGAVMAAELFNSAIEALADAVQPNHDDRIRNVKDLAAGGVLLTSLVSAIIGAIILLPPLLEKLNP